MIKFSYVLSKPFFICLNKSSFVLYWLLKTNKTNRGDSHPKPLFSLSTNTSSILYIPVSDWAFCTHSITYHVVSNHSHISIHFLRPIANVCRIIPATNLTNPIIKFISQIDSKENGVHENNIAFAQCLLANYWQSVTTWSTNEGLNHPRISTHVLQVSHLQPIKNSEHGNEDGRKRSGWLMNH